MNTKYFAHGLRLMAVFVLLLAALAPVQTARAAGVIRVTTGGTTTWPCGDTWASACALQTALANAVSGDEIWVAAGTYTPAGPGGDRTVSFELKSGVGLYGGFAGSETSRDQRDWNANLTTLSGDLNGDDGVNFTNNGENSYTVVLAQDVSGAALDGFTIRGGNANGLGGAFLMNGGGFFNENSNTTIANVTFAGNSAGSGGGGMYNKIWTYSGPLPPGPDHPTLTDVIFSGNRASDGGGMVNNLSSPRLLRVTFSDNTAGRGGGMSNNGLSSPELQNVSFIHNTADDSGGGIYNQGANTALTNVVFSDNSAYYFGGGLYNDSSSPTLVNATFNGNMVTCTDAFCEDPFNSGGGGIYNYRAFTMTNSILWGNSAMNGAQIQNATGFSGAISHSLIQDAFLPGQWDSSIVAYSSVWDSRLGVDAGGNLDADPLFLDSAAGDLRLQPWSPANDAGDQTALPAGIEYDLAGNPRISGPEVDLGAYELQQNSPAVVEAGSDQSLGEGSRIAVNAAFSDSEPGDTYRATIDWGDGTVTAGTLTETDGSGAVTGEHVYWHEGSYTVSVKVTDSSGAHGADGLLATVSQVNNIWYVDSGASGKGYGDTWVDAFTNLHFALAAANAGDQVWVAADTYHPAGPNGDKTISFVLKSGVAVYGGFNGTETSLSQRDWMNNVTILSGDLNGDDVWGSNGYDSTGTSDNSYGVVYADSVDRSAVLDGFTITGGHESPYIEAGSLVVRPECDSTNEAYIIPGCVGGGLFNYKSSPTLSNLIFLHNWADYDGGGMYNFYSDPTLIDVIFSENAAYRGGGMVNDSSSPTLVNTIFSGNIGLSSGGGMANLTIRYYLDDPDLTYVVSQPSLTNVIFLGNWSFSGMLEGHGGGMYNVRSTPTLTNVTFYGNTPGRAISNGGSSPIIANSILWGNSPTADGAQVENGSVEVASRPRFYNSDIQNAFASGSWDTSLGVDGGGNIAADPLFVDTADGDLHLQPGSPALDAGDLTRLPADSLDLDGDGNILEPIPYDFDGNPRVMGGQVDMGAYEYQEQVELPAPVLDTISPASTTAGSGDVNLSLTGSGFVSASTVRWNGTDLATTFISATQLSAVIPASSLTGVQTAQISVFTPAPGGGASAIKGFFVTLSPANVTAQQTGSGAAAIPGIDVTTSGSDPVIVAQYDANPGGTPSFAATNAYFDVYIPPGGAFGWVTIAACNLNGGSLVYWWDGTAWALASSQTYDSATSCVTITVDATTSPSLSDLTGTVFGAGSLAAPTVALASSQNPSTVGQPVTFNAQVTGSFGAPTGTVTFKDNGADITGCVDVNLVSGQADCSLTTLSVGAHTITAFYSGDGTYASATGALSTDQQVNCPSAITVANANDNGAGSLRQAIADVCAGGTITFDGDYTIPLASQLTIGKSLTIDGAGQKVTISGNNAVRAFYVNSGVTSTLQNLTIANGSAYEGGGILNRGSLYVTNVTFSGNSSTVDGGAIHNYSAASLTNATFSGNSASGSGGAISNRATLALTNVTISGNSASGFGGGIFDYEGHLTLTNVIASGDSGYSEIWCDHAAGGSASGQNNVIWPFAGGSGCYYSYSTVDPLLGSLGDYGGSTQTLPLLPGSPAIDAGDDAVCAAAPVNNLDQRGVARPQGAGCDIGAFESRGFTLTKTGGDNQSTSINNAFAQPLALSVTSANGEPVDGGLVIFTPPTSGASATITGSPAAIVDGMVSVTATANDIEDTYEVAASSAGAPGVSFSLTNTAPPDTTPPVITPQIDGTLGQGGWYLSDVALTWSVVDDESEFTSNGCDPVSITSDQPETIYTCEATSAGGTSSASVSIKRDATLPVVAVTGVTEGSVYILGAVPEAGCSTSDGMSGVATEASLSLTGGNALGVGSFTAACSGALDNAGNAGNTATVQYNVTFLFTGFTSPVDNPPVMNIAKAGQTIPLKWRITDANGNPITDLTSVTVTAVSLPCSAGETTDPIEEYAAGESGLQNLGDGYFQWNWKTPKSYANSCKTMRLDLGEGVGFEHIALFQLKK